MTTVPGAVHEHLNVLGSVDLATLVGAAKSAGLVATGDLAVADDGSVGLRSAAAVWCQSALSFVLRQLCPYLEEQSRGVPSATVKPGIVTPLAPLTLMTIP